MKASSNADARSGAGIAPRPGKLQGDAVHPCTVEHVRRLGQRRPEHARMKRLATRAEPENHQPGRPIRPFEGRSSDSPRVPLKNPSTSSRES